MFLARIEGTVVAAAKHPTLDGCRFLVAQRLEADGTAAAEPKVVVDWMGAARGSTVLVSTDGDIARAKLRQQHAGAHGGGGHCGCGAAARETCSEEAA